MNIHAKLTLRFSIIVASILLAFSVAVFALSANYRMEEFYTRLESRAVTAARLLLSVEEVDQNLLRIIDANSIYALNEEKVLVYDDRDSLIYSSPDSLPNLYSHAILDSIRHLKKLEYSEYSIEHVGIAYTGTEGEFVVLASAYDRYGRSKLNNLGRVLLIGLLVGIFIIVFTGRIFAKQVLVPLARINAEVSTISAGSLNQRIDEGNQKDEIAQLAMNFNKMLERLESAFEVQQQFVSHASHELRTPLAVITSQLQASLEKDRSVEEYKDTLRSLSDDTRKMIEITNGLLLLARSGLDKHRLAFRPVRIDEVLFAAQMELKHNHPEYLFHIEYKEAPDDESAFMVMGNEQLLRTVFLNLMENACKFSKDKSVQILLSWKRNQLELSFTDKGIGIPKDEIGLIFTPFYRASNALGTAKGHGIGLAMCRRIILMHEGKLELHSVQNAGSRFTVILPSLPSI